MPQTNDITTRAIRLALALLGSLVPGFIGVTAGLVALWYACGALRHSLRRIDADPAVGGFASAAAGAALLTTFATVGGVGTVILPLLAAVATGVIGVPRTPSVTHPTVPLR